MTKILYWALMGIWLVFPLQSFAGEPLTLKWSKDNQVGASTYSLSEEDELYFISPAIKLGDISVSPYLMYQIKNPFGAPAVSLYGGNPLEKGTPLPLNALGNNCFWGIDLDARLEAASAWFSGIYEKGGPKEQGTMGVFLISAGGDFAVGDTGLHGQAVYTAGKETASKEENIFLTPKGASYFWSEMLENRPSSNDESFPENSADKMTNIMALNLGASHKPTKNLTVKADVWYVLLADPGMNETVSKKKPGDLGTEIDITVSYEMIKGLNVDMIAAYLISGQASEVKENPLGLGTQFSLDF